MQIPVLEAELVRHRFEGTGYRCKIVAEEQSSERNGHGESDRMFAHVNG